jgi:signal recognition particle receptor subunit beta
VASLNTAARELVLKIVYYGPGLGGKTTSLQALHEAAPPERRGKLVSLATPVDRTLYFDFLPLRLPPLRGLSVRLQLFTVPGQVYFNATRRLVLSGADGIVFVADSQVDRLDANLESLENLRENLAEHGRDLAVLPHVFAWNKRDLPEIVPADELDKLMNRHHVPAFPTIATQRQGVQETLDEITARVLAAYEAQVPVASVPPASSTADLPPTVDIRHGTASGEREEEIETSADTRRLSAGEALEVVTSSVLLAPSEGTFLADLERIERTATPAAPEPEEEKESVVGEAWETENLSAEAARPPTSPPEARRGGIEPTLSFGPLFAPQERALIEQIEASIAHGAWSDALGVCDATLSRLLSAVAASLSADGASTQGTDPVVPLLLGLDGRRYLAFRALARRARQIGDVGARDALESYAFLLEARVAAGQWDALRAAVGANSAPPLPRASAPPSPMPPLPRGSVSTSSPVDASGDAVVTSAK